MKSDEELMLAYQEGDEKSFNEIYGRYSARVYGYLRKRLDQKNWVDDVFQMVFVKVHKSRHQYDPAYRVDQWIFVMTKSVLLDFWKTTDVKTKRFYSKSLETLPEVQFPTVSPQSDVVSLMPELSALSKEQREAVEFKFIDELSYHEIAQKLKSSESNVRQLVSRGIRKLRAALKTTGGTP